MTSELGKGSEAMDRDEVLRRSRNSGGDEGKDAANSWADLYGFTALCVAIMVLVVYKIMKDLPVGDLISLPFIFLAVGIGARFIRDRERTDLLFGILGAVLAVGALTTFVIQTW